MDAKEIEVGMRRSVPKFHLIRRSAEEREGERKADKGRKGRKGNEG